MTRRSSSPALPIPEQLVVIQSREGEVPQQASFTGHVWDITPHGTFGITRRAGRLGPASTLPGIPCQSAWEQRGSVCRLWSLLPAAGHTRGGERGGRRRGACRQQQPRARSPDFFSVSCLLCSHSTSLGLQHPHPLSKNSALQAAMISVRMILCITIIPFAQINGSALNPKPKTGLQFYPHVTLPGSAMDRGKSALQ